ncbi:hypothetical protein phiST2_0278 [Vibrio phage phi-ST2]|uniref:Uncharacterized protein n=2 Tax=Schizotequatrovirus TaxID=1198137 RepID=A0A140B3M3_9CAUD|nr:hypothetical protein CF80_gp253 [Vibrio phage VH7D]ALP47297.1 hypothetical protein phiGrn1_0148 [Vibrio phage phi-Grn1]ALP47677.1 hypothetical protein phiST2_0278 [Vibrio phage phi-ST2]QBX06056.1 hypothetical protein Va3_102 [Vibrio phage Va3]QNJ54682.1 hypothetical protein vBValMR10Z_141 [Vibrio phage vB_ValM_R10Z]QNJ55068.1 hypothetical protein vBValMR11Z_142 [Vibrio phage vB_ValM_R11Z]URQ03617.1 hypothetical protein PVA23_240 [Vibrio phage PVA23]
MNLGEFVTGLLTLIAFGIVAMLVILGLSVGGLIFGAWLIISGHTVAGWVVLFISAIVFALIGTIMRNL